MSPPPPTHPSFPLLHLVDAAVLEQLICQRAVRAAFAGSRGSNDVGQRVLAATLHREGSDGGFREPRSQGIRASSARSVLLLPRATCPCPCQQPSQPRNRSAPHPPLPHRRQLSVPTLDRLPASLLAVPQHQHGDEGGARGCQGRSRHDKPDLQARQAAHAAVGAVRDPSGQVRGAVGAQLQRWRWRGGGLGRVRQGGPSQGGKGLAHTDIALADARPCWERERQRGCSLQARPGSHAERAGGGQAGRRQRGVRRRDAPAPAACTCCPPLGTSQTGRCRAAGGRRGCCRAPAHCEGAVWPATRVLLSHAGCAGCAGSTGGAAGAAGHQERVGAGEPCICAPTALESIVLAAGLQAADALTGTPRQA